MRTRGGFTLVEAIVITALIFAALAVFVPSLGSRCGPAPNRTVCAANLTGIYKCIYTYGVFNNSVFPVAGAATPGGHGVGFREGDRATGRGAILQNNLTASLWMLARSGAASPRSFVCPSTTDSADPLKTPDGHAAELKNTHDFTARRNLSYSTINMYHKTLGPQWSANAPSDFVLMSDNNANGFAGQPGRHTLAKDATKDDVARAENSPNHGYDGENFLYGDGHVAYSNDPFVGRNDDNAFAMRVAGRNVAPTLGNTDGDAASDAKLVNVDSWMVPLSGNGGGTGSVSGLAVDVSPGPPPREPWDVPWLIVSGLLLLIPVPLAAWAVAFGLSFRKRKASSIDEPRP